MKRLLFMPILICLLFLSPNVYSATYDFDFFGTFNYDNDITLLDFTVGETSTITIFSSSWGDDNSYDGYVAEAGFDPILAIWDNAGILVNEQDDGYNVGSTLSNGILYDHGTWDSYYDVFLTAGSYTASIAQYDNFAIGSSLSDGFDYDGNPNFTYDEGYGTQSYFNGVWDSDDPRTGDWAFHILNVAEASQQERPIPEPATMLLLGSGLVGLAGFRRKKNSKK